MGKFILKNQKSLLRFLTIYFSFNLILLFLGKYTSLVIDRYYNINLITYSLLVIPFIYFFILIQKDKEYYKEKFEAYFKYGFLISLLLATIGSLKFSFIENVRILEVIVKFLSTQSLIITTLAIGLGFFAFYFNRDKIGQEIEKEQESEKIMEEKRKAEFASKFPKTNKIPVLRNLVKWAYKEGWGYSLPFILITIIFIAIRICMPLFYGVSYIDEYFHLFSGINFFKSGEFPIFYTDGFQYVRGFYVSIAVGLMMYLFGETIMIAKMVPAIIGIFNFFIFFLIAKKIIRKKIYILLLLTIYTLHPGIIFNHFYIRVYVFYELFTLLTIFCFLKIKKPFSILKNWRNLTFYFVLVCITILIIALFHDYAAFPILMLLGILMSYLIFFESSLSKNTKILILLGVLLTILMTNSLEKIDVLLNASKTYTSPENHKYTDYFFGLNYIFTFFFLLSLATLNHLKSKQAFFVLGGVCLFILHLISSRDLQIFRGILYFIPVFLIISIRGLLFFKCNRFIKFIIIFLMMTIITTSFSYSFLNNGPNIEGEIRNIDYNSAYKFVSDSCRDKVIYALHHHPYISIFHGVHPDYINILDLEKINNGMNIYVEDPVGSYRTIYGGIKVVSNKDLIKQIISEKKDVCIIMRSSKEHNFRYITQEEEFIIDASLNKKEFEEITVFYTEY